MMRVLVFLMFLFLGRTSFAHEVPNHLSEQEKINYLLNTIGNSQLIFVRNGEEYPGQQAKEHLQMKLKASGNAIQTAEEFISTIASHSSMTGKPYYVELPEGKMIEAEKMAAR